MKSKIVLIKFFLFIFIVLMPLSARASAQVLTEKLGQIVAKSERGNEKLGVEIVSLNKGDVLYQHNSAEPLNPASCTKVFTTAAALKLLGPDYRFHTMFYTDQRPTGGRAGKLWVKAYGDPSIVIERLWKMARDISNTGLKTLDGDIVIDDYYFEDYKYPGYTDGSGRAYNSMTGAASLNYNTVTVIITPSSRVGAPPSVTTDGAGPYFRIENRATTGGRGTKNTVSAARQTENGEDVIIASGSIPVQSETVYIYRNITNPPIYFGLALKSLLAENGVTVKGSVVRGYFPGGGYLLLDSISKPLSQIVVDMNKFSNNFIAEQLVKTLGAQIGDPPGTTEKGIRVMENFLAHLQIPNKGYELHNGSGLTPDNKISASALTAVLANAYADPRIGPEVVASFSIAGVDGTIKKRHNSNLLKGLVRAKTGTLYGVSSLVGIVPSSDGEMLGYAILMNGTGIGWEESHSAQEKMLDAMALFRR